jgi:hypothetical protein
MRKRIVYTRFDGGVTVSQPSETIISWMGNGGFWSHCLRGFCDRQIESMIARGVRADTARRYVRAMTLGGCTTAEALEIIRDRDCGHLGAAIELWDMDDVPQDRWFRDAWRRSHNGGPIMIDLKKAKPIQFAHARSFVEMENKRRSTDLNLWNMPIEVDWPRFREHVLCARDEVDLRRIWPA